MKNFNWAVSIAKYVLVYSTSCKIVHAQVCKIVFKRVDKKSYLEKVKWIGKIIDRKDWDAGQEPRS